MVAALVVIIVIHKPLWKATRELPLLSVFYELQLLVRSLRFVMSYIPLYKAGIVANDALILLQRQEKGENAIVYDGMLIAIQQGLSLSQTIDTPYWSGILRAGFSGFEQLEETARPTVLENMVSVLRLQQGVYSRRVAATMKTIGMLITVVAILCIVFGFMLPMQSLKPA